MWNIPSTFPHRQFNTDTELKSAHGRGLLYHLSSHLMGMEAVEISIFPRPVYMRPGERAPCVVGFLPQQRPIRHRPLVAHHAFPERKHGDLVFRGEHRSI